MRVNAFVMAKIKVSLLCFSKDLDQYSRPATVYTL